MKKPGLALAALLLAGCAMVPQRCPVSGDTRTLAGVWEGEFVSTYRDHSGTIRFQLQAGQDSAYGDVLILAGGWTRAGARAETQPARQLLMQQLVRVSFVHVAFNHVRGTLDEYRDLLCDCMLQTFFDGELKGERIEGRYLTRRAQGGPLSEGIFFVARVSSEPHARIDRDHAAVEGKDRVQVKFR